MSKNAEVVQGEVVAPSVGVVTAISATAVKVRSLLVQAHPDNQGTVKVGYDTAAPVMNAPFAFDPIDGKLYNLAKVVIKTETAGDTVTFIGTK